MIIINNIPFNKFSWLSGTYPEGCGVINNFYEPETVDELQALCLDFYQRNIKFEIIGHTSNTLYTPSFHCEHLISTRKLNRFEIMPDAIVCECGTSVRKLAIYSIENGISGFEGLIDLPGTVAASLYGNAGCYDCSIAKLLVSATVLMSDGSIKNVSPEWFSFRNRSSVLKRKEKEAIILTIRLSKKNADPAFLKAKAEQNHITRINTQPEAKRSLGTVFCDQGGPTFLNILLTAITKLYGIILRLRGYDPKTIWKKRTHLTFVLLRATDVETYVINWNWYQWRDEKAHELFWKYVKLHKRMFTKSEFEIEIKLNKDLS